MADYEKTIHLYDDGIGRVQYISHMGDDVTVVNAARVSFGRESSELDARDRKLIRYLIAHKHTSTLEHCCPSHTLAMPRHCNKLSLYIS